MYDAWTIGDRACAEEFSTDEALDELFSVSGQGNNWVFQGCFNEGQEQRCAYTYPGGSASFLMQLSVIDGWVVTTVEFFAD